MLIASTLLALSLSLSASASLAHSHLTSPRRSHEALTRRGGRPHKRCSIKPTTPVLTSEPAPTSAPIPTSTSTPGSEGGASGGSVTLSRGIPSEGIRGVNLGAWFVFEMYMAYDEWQSMGGHTDGCDAEFELTGRLGQDAADAAFKTHWDTWITQDDVALMKKYNLNSVRIPIGFWIIESTVNADETYPRGGLEFLKRGCKWLREAGISVLLDLHAAPGASSPHQTFAGRCVDTPGFWGNQDNIDRHVKAGTELMRLVHTDPDSFGSVYGMEVLNEPPNDAGASPGYQDFLQQFVNAVRGVEDDLNIPQDERLTMVFMDISWQYGDGKANPATIESGGNAYDKHTYFNWGPPGGPQGSAGHSLDEHVSFVCNGDAGQIAADAQQNNTPLFKGEWWLLPSNKADNSGPVFDLWDKDSVRRFGDAQKRGFSPDGGMGGAGYYFWSWKMTNSDGDGLNHMRSYKDAVAGGWMHEDAAQYFNPNGGC
ncbi:glycoside hydrolase [Exidia glandulosa HHB12029]|uniref:glucan 1,3-beta-glucosidase n=1 Tax=Exidia glandulosa HHB12029 TaxID=1314781 RepID=A0A165E928_EXIGL|nr:glycoside hydrolase [Exidia glandulosa HHB12029]